MDLIDTHQHLILRRSLGYAWADAIPALAGRDFDRADYAALVAWARACGAPVLALDVPTGLDADTGALHEPAIRATATATFIALKPGLLTGDGLDAATALAEMWWVRCSAGRPR